MDIKLTVGDLVAPNGPFQRVRACRPDSPAIGFKIAMALKALQPAIDSHDEQKNQLLDEFGTPVEGERGAYHFRESDAPNAKIDSERWEAYQEKYIELAAVEVELDFPKLTLQDLTEANVQPPLSPDEIMALFWLIDDPQLGTNEKRRPRKRKRKPDDDGEG